MVRIHRFRSAIARETNIRAFIANGLERGELLVLEIMLLLELLLWLLASVKKRHITLVSRSDSDLLASECLGRIER